MPYHLHVHTIPQAWHPEGDCPKMDYSVFLSLLNDEMNQASQTSSGHQIIRFAKPQQYYECLLALAKLKPTLKISGMSEHPA